MKTHCIFLYNNEEYLTYLSIKPLFNNSGNFTELFKDIRSSGNLCDAMMMDKKAAKSKLKTLGKYGVSGFIMNFSHKKSYYQLSFKDSNRFEFYINKKYLNPFETNSNDINPTFSIGVSSLNKLIYYFDDESICKKYVIDRNKYLNVSNDAFYKLYLDNLNEDDTFKQILRESNIDELL